VKTSIAPHRIVLSLCTATVTSLSILAITNSVQAAVVQFTDLASFQANTTGLTTIDFEGGTGNFTNYPYFAGGLTTSGVNFNSPALYVANQPSSTLFDWGSGAVLADITGRASLLVTLPSGVTAFGSDIMSFNAYASPFNISLSTGQTFNLNSLNYPNRKFVGFTSDTAITSISFTATAGNTLLDNFRFGTASPAAATSVPEPFTVIGTLVGGTTALRMRKKLKSARK
jgi:hypothetical protein